MLLVSSAALGWSAESPVVQSHKRGVCANELSAADFDALRPGVAWWYNWFHETKDTRPGMEFEPMIWNGASDRIAGARRYLAGAPKPRVLMALNEPNLTGQANLAPKDAAARWTEIVAVARSAGVPLVGPHMAIGAPDNEVVKGWDPIQGKERNLSYMIDFLDAFFHYVKPDQVDGIGVHAYGNIWELKWAVDELYKKYGKPIWVTEFAEWGANGDDAEIAYMIAAVDFFERSPHVAGYAWFKERMGQGGGKMSLLEPESGKLTRLGELYVHMPIHDPAAFYHVPGRMEAESDIAMKGVALEPTRDTDGWLNVCEIETGDWIDYQINVGSAGTYELAVRLAGASPIRFRITQDSRDLGAINVARPQGTQQWETATTTLHLAAGRQTIRLEAQSSGAALNWLEFSYTP